MNKRKISLLLCIVLVMQLALAGCDNGSSQVEDGGTESVATDAVGEQDDTQDEQPVEADPEHVTLFFNTGEELTLSTFEQLVMDGAIEDEMSSSLFYIPPSDEKIFGTEEYYAGRKELVNKLIAEGNASYNKALEMMKYIDPVQSNLVWALEEMYSEGSQPEFVDTMLSEQGHQIERVLMTKAEAESFSETSDDPYVDAWLKEYKLIAQLKFADEVLTYFNRVHVDVMAYLQATEDFGGEEFKMRRQSLDGASYISPEKEELYFSMMDHLKFANEYYDALEESDYYYSVALLEEFIKYSDAANNQIEKSQSAYLSDEDMLYLTESTEVYNEIARHMLKLLIEAGNEDGYQVSHSEPSKGIFESFGLVAFADSIPENETYKKSLKTQETKPEKNERSMTLFGALTSVTEGVWNVGKSAVGKVADVTVATVKTVKDTGVLLTGNKKFDQYKRDISNAASIVTGTSGNSINLVNETIDETVDTVSNLPQKVFGENKFTKTISKAAKSAMKVGLVKVKTTLKLVDKDTTVMDIPSVLMNTGADVLMEEASGYKKEVVSQAQQIVKSLVPEKYHKSVEKYAKGAEKIIDKVSDLTEYKDMVKNPNKFLKDRFIKPKAEKVMNKLTELQSKVKEKVVEKFDEVFDQTAYEEKYTDHEQLKPATKAKENIRTNDAIKTSTNLNEKANDKVKEWQIKHLENYNGLEVLRERHNARSATFNQTEEASEDFSEEMDEAPEGEESTAPESDETAMPEDEPEAEAEEMEAEAEPEAEAEGVEAEAEPESEETESVEEDNTETDSGEESGETNPEESTEEMTEESSEESSDETTGTSDLAGNYSGYAKKITVDGEFSSPLGQGNSRLSLNLNDGGTGQMTLEIFGTGMMDMTSTLSITSPAVQSGNNISISTVDDEGDPIKVSGVLSGNNLSGTIHIVTGGSNIVLEFTATK